MTVIDETVTDHVIEGNRVIGQRLLRKEDPACSPAKACSPTT